MERVYVFGHRNPDTDSVTSAIALAYLRRKQGINTVPAILSSVNRETQYALNYFGVKEPVFLNDLKLKVRDLAYSKGYMAQDNISIYEAYRMMEQEEISKIPIVNKNQKILGILSMKDIARDCLIGEYSNIDTCYKNILLAIDGEKVLKFDQNIKGRLIIPGFRSTTFINEIKLKRNDILITGNRYSIIDYAIKSKVRLIVVTCNLELDQEQIVQAEANKVNIIKTKYSTLDTIKKFNFCNNAGSIIKTSRVHTVNENDDLSDFITAAEKTKYTYYPVVNNNNKCLGIVKFANVSYQNRKKVILVDHNSYEQSAIGLSEAEIMEIIDHHNISNIGTTHPINFRNMPVGSTCTIVYLMYRENNIKIPKNMAGMMLSGILSDTLLLNSPTTTDIDREAIKSLAKIAEVDYKEYGFNMISYGTNLSGKTKEEILYTDFKKYPTEEGRIGLGQIMTTNIEEIKKEKNEYIDMLNRISDMNDFKFIALFVTDIIKNGTYVFYSKNAKEILEKAFGIEFQQGTYLQDVVSRKIQILPSILDIMN